MEIINYQQDKTITDALGSQELALAVVRTPNNKNISWLVTLDRVNRRDNASPFYPGDVPLSKPAYFSQVDGFNAAVQSAPQANITIPPRRTNPVSDLTIPNGQFVIVKWSMGGNSFKLLADWPSMGTSFVISASKVEIFAVCDLSSNEIVKNKLPVFNCAVSRLQSSNNYSPYGGTLGLSQDMSINETTFDMVGGHNGGSPMGVPDFAKTIQVTLAIKPTAAIYAQAPPTTLWAYPNSRCIMVWYSDNGRIVSTELIQMNGINSKFDVPPKAVMVAFHRHDPSVDLLPTQVFVHWRISP